MSDTTPGLTFGSTLITSRPCSRSARAASVEGGDQGKLQFGIVQRRQRKLDIGIKRPVGPDQRGQDPVRGRADKGDPQPPRAPRPDQPRFAPGRVQRRQDAAGMIQQKTAAKKVD